MTNVSGPGKVAVRNFLKRTALRELERQGYKVERIPRAGKSSLRMITKDGASQKVTIRTSQDTWYAFPRNDTNTGWSTLEDAEVVVVASLTEKESARANFHIMPADDIRARFDRAYTARVKAGHVIPEKRGIWLSLYEPEGDSPVSHVGAGAGLAYKPFAAEVPIVIDAKDLGAEDDEDIVEKAFPLPPQAAAAPTTASDDSTLTIAEAKRRLALTFGVDPSAIKIIVEG
jgi:hypothetical protein